MPNRILRDWTDSDKVDALSAEAERFFTRLIMKADDFGRYSADPKRLKAFLFPLKDALRETDCSRWLAECEKAGLVRCYEAAGKRFTEIADFRQRLRQMREIYPKPPSDGSPPPADGRVTAGCPPNRIESNRIENEGEERPRVIDNLPEIPDYPQAFAQTAAAAIPEPFCRYVYDDWSSRSGKDGGGNVVAWLPYVTKRWTREQNEWRAGTHKGKKSGPAKALKSQPLPQFKGEPMPLEKRQELWRKAQQQQHRD